MSNLSPEAKKLVAMAQGADDPTSEDRARMDARLGAILGVGAIGAGVGASGAGAGAGAGAGLGTSGAGAGVGASGAGLGASGAGAGAGAGLGVAGKATAAATGAKVAGGAGLGAKLASLGLAGKLMVGTAVVATTSVGVYEATTRVAPAFRAPTVATVATAVAVDAPKGVAKGGERTPDAVPSVAAPAVPGAEAEPQAATTPAAAPSAVPSGALSRVPGAAGAGTEKGANDKSGTESVLAQEIALVREAQAALAAGDATTALGKLAEHERRFPQGALGEERAAAQVFALCGSGRKAEGQAKARRFLEQHPASPLAARVRAACEK